MMIFFLDANGKIYSRYGGRDSEDAENRQSLAGLRYTMQSVLEMHERDQPVYAESEPTEPYYLKNQGFRNRCVHCHNAKERIYNELDRQGKWTRELAWRYPPPDNLGLVLDVDRGNVVKKVLSNTPAAEAGIKPGDTVQVLNKVPIHSFGDAQYSLDKAPETGKVDIRWLREGEPFSAKLNLPKHWRKADNSWRRSLIGHVPYLYMYGDDLPAEEKKQHGLSAAQTAFRLEKPLPTYAKSAGLTTTDVIVGVDAEATNLTMPEFQRYVRSHYLVGDQVQLNVIREGKRMNVQIKLVR